MLFFSLVQCNYSSFPPSVRILLSCAFVLPTLTCMCFVLFLCHPWLSRHVLLLRTLALPFLASVVRTFLCVLYTPSSVFCTHLTQCVVRTLLSVLYAPYSAFCTHFTQRFVRTLLSVLYAPYSAFLFAPYSAFCTHLTQRFVRTLLSVLYAPYSASLWIPC